MNKLIPGQRERSPDYATSYPSSMAVIENHFQGCYGMLCGCCNRLNE
jgi:hypothetical protein